LRGKVDVGVPEHVFYKQLLQLLYVQFRSSFGINKVNGYFAKGLGRIVIQMRFFCYGQRIEFDSVIIAECIIYVFTRKKGRNRTYANENCI
jgi:hypothetical protein